MPKNYKKIKQLGGAFICPSDIENPTSPLTTWLKTVIIGPNIPPIPNDLATGEILLALPSDYTDKLLKKYPEIDSDELINKLEKAETSDEIITIIYNTITSVYPNLRTTSGITSGTNTTSGTGIGIGTSISSSRAISVSTPSPRMVTFDQVIKEYKRQNPKSNSVDGIDSNDIYLIKSAFRNGLDEIKQISIDKVNEIFPGKFAMTGGRKKSSSSNKTPKKKSKNTSKKNIKGGKKTSKKTSKKVSKKNSKKTSKKTSKKGSKNIKGGKKIYKKTLKKRSKKRSKKESKKKMNDSNKVSKIRKRSKKISLKKGGSWKKRGSK